MNTCKKNMYKRDVLSFLMFLGSLIFLLGMLTGGAVVQAVSGGTNAPVVVVEPYDDTVEEINVIEEITEPPVTDPVVETPEMVLTDEEIDLIALLTMAEVEGQSEEAKRLVIDTILNRVEHEHFPDTVEGVIYQPNQFTPMWNGRIERCEVREDIRQLVLEELMSRTNYDVVFFRADHYFKSYGTPVTNIDNVYFSSL